MKLIKISKIPLTTTCASMQTHCIHGMLLKIVHQFYSMSEC